MTLFKLYYFYNVAWKNGFGWRLEKVAVVDSFPGETEKSHGKPQE
jgi:hypothetical protein